MSDALYGGNGFYRRRGAPARHFRTAAHVGDAWITAIHELATRVDDALGRPANFSVVDVGAGGGELLAGLAERADARWSLIGVDIAGRPEELPPRIEWRHTTPAQVTGLLLAVELLDVVPLNVVEIADDGPRIVEVNEYGERRCGGLPDRADLDWLQRHWNHAESGDRIEIGVHRDALWRELVASVHTGVAVAIDYAVAPSPGSGATLTGFRDGQQVAPVPDGSCDLTAHVHFESLRSDGAVLLSQRDALRTLGMSATRPDYDGDPAAYLASLSASGEAAELLSRDGLGGFTWLVSGVDIDPALVLPRSTPAARTEARTSSTHR